MYGSSSIIFSEDSIVLDAWFPLICALFEEAINAREPSVLEPPEELMTAFLSPRAVMSPVPAITALVWLTAKPEVVASCMPPFKLIGTCWYVWPLIEAATL